MHSPDSWQLNRHWTPTTTSRSTIPRVYAICSTSICSVWNGGRSETKPTKPKHSTNTQHKSARDICKLYVKCMRTFKNLLDFIVVRDN